jgi:hypothetical protein
MEVPTISYCFCVFNIAIWIFQKFKSCNLTKSELLINQVFFLLINYSNWSNLFFTILKLNYLNCFSHFQILTFNLPNCKITILQINCYSSTKTLSTLHYKTWQIHNLLKMDIFCSKLVSFLLSVTFTGLDKHTSLLRNLILWICNVFIVKTPGVCHDTKSSANLI